MSHIANKFDAHKSTHSIFQTGCAEPLLLAINTHAVPLSRVPGDQVTLCPWCRSVPERAEGSTAGSSMRKRTNVRLTHMLSASPRQAHLTWIQPRKLERTPVNRKPVRKAGDDAVLQSLVTASLSQCLCVRQAGPPCVPRPPRRCPSFPWLF